MKSAYESDKKGEPRDHTCARSGNIFKIQYENRKLFLSLLFNEKIECKEVKHRIVC